MKLSFSIQLIWQLAAREAIAGKFKNIEPEHFFAAVLKFSELPLEELKKVTQDAGSSEELATELDAVRQRLNQHPFDSTRIRRQLRALLGRSNHIYTGGNMHRSAASKQLFDSAFKLAADSNSKIVKAIHLLQAIFDSPTPRITQVLNEAKIQPVFKTFPTPLLDRLGQDLTDHINQGKSFKRAGRKAEAKAFMRALDLEDHPCVFLVTDKDEDAQQVVEAELNRVGSLLERQYYKRVHFDDLLPMCLVLREGARADARTLKSQTEIFKFCQLFKTDRIDEVFEQIDAVEFILDGAFKDMDPAVRALFEQQEPFKILLVTDTNLAALYTENISEFTWRTATSAEDALQVLAEEEVDMVLLDLWVGRSIAETSMLTIQHFDHVPAAARGLDLGQEVLRKIRERLPNCPVYLLSLSESQEEGSDESTVDYELFIACVRGGGARGMIISRLIDQTVQDWKAHRDRLVSHLLETCRRLYHEKAADRMGQERKVLNFDTAPKVSSDDKKIAIRLRNLRFTRAISSADALSSPVYIKLNEAANKILREQMDKTINLLQQNRRHMDAVVDALVATERLTAEELQVILPPTPGSDAETVYIKSTGKEL